MKTIYIEFHPNERLRVMIAELPLVLDIDVKEEHEQSENFYHTFLKNFL